MRNEERLRRMVVLYRAGHDSVSLQKRDKPCGCAMCREAQELLDATTDGPEMEGLRKWLREEAGGSGYRDTYDTGYFDAMFRVLRYIADTFGYGDKDDE